MLKKTKTARFLPSFEFCYFVVFQLKKRQQTTTNAYSRLQTLVVGFILDKGYYFASSNNEMQHKMELPEYIEGIPTAKNRSAERRNMIKSFYINLLKMFQREGRASTVFNEFLGVDVYIKQGESDKKPSMVLPQIGNPHGQ